jgi:xylulokinase
VLLTVDIGTSSFKSALWDYDGNRLASAQIPLSIITDGIIYEADCTLWLKAFEDCCQKLTSFTPSFDLSLIEVIVISGNGPSLVPVTDNPDKNAENARLWLDRRAVKYQKEVSELMGGFVDAGFFLPKILAIKNEEPLLYRQTKCFLGCPEYLAYYLTGESRTVFPSEGFDRWFWNESILEKLDLDPDKFPSFISPGERFGLILPSIAEKMGFQKNIPVISGGPDFYAAILGAGVIKPGQACDRTGFSEGINLCTNKFINDGRLMSYGHPVKPYWNLSGIINTTGKVIDWFRELFEIPCYEDFFSLAEKSKPGSGGLVFLPYLAGERSPLWNPSLRSLWSGIGLSSARCDFANSILEGIAFAIRDVLTVMKEADEIESTCELRVTGKLAGSALLNRIKADITGKTILEPVQKEAELTGLAIIGACSLGKYSSITEASSVMVKIEKYYEPDLKNSDIYNELFEKYKNYQTFF